MPSQQESPSISSQFVQQQHAIYNDTTNRIDENLFALTRLKGLLHDDLIAMGSLAKKILTSVASFTGLDEQLVSTELLKTICSQVAFEPSAVLDVIDAKMKIEEEKLSQARIVRDKTINEFIQL